MTQPSSDYHAWVLRLWREDTLNTWRIALENVSSRERKGFTGFEQLVAYLQEFCEPPASDTVAPAADWPEPPQSIEEVS